MRIIYSCPQCGNDLREQVLTCNPPIFRYICYKCGWKHDGQKTTTLRVPFPYILQNGDMNGYTKKETIS